MRVLNVLSLHSLLTFGGLLRATLLMLSPLTALLLTVNPVGAAEAHLLDGAAYEERLHALLDQATGSVDAMIYLVHLPDAARPGQPVRRIIDHLAAVQRRGVAVRVILDAGTPPGQGDARPNLPAATALRAAGIDVRWDEDDRVTHAKAVVVDGRHCLLGSGNWTAGALRFNRELNIHVDDVAVAAQFAAMFAPAWELAAPVR